MNWLAHTLLSKKNIDYQLGNVLADPLRGSAWNGASEALLEGMNMHKAIDKFTDQHPILSLSKGKLGSDGHLKGVVLDLLYDHFLSSSWLDYSAVELKEFLMTFNQRALLSSRTYPSKPKTIVGNIVAANLLGRYQTFSGLVGSLERIDQRLSPTVRMKETATQYIPRIEQQYKQLKFDFSEFFPDLIEYFKNHSLGSKNNHFLN